MVGTWATTAWIRIGGAEHEGVPTGVAGPPDPDSVGVDALDSLQERDRGAPVLDLGPRVDVLAGLTAAGAEAAVIVGQHREPGSLERATVVIQTVFTRRAEPVGHGDRISVRAVQPARQSGSVGRR
jgi:hypothetical protein